MTQPANGTVVITNAGADLTYEPDADYCNDGIADRRLHLHAGRRRDRDVEVTVNCVDDATVAVDDTKTVDEDDPATHDRRPRQRHRRRQRRRRADRLVTQPANGTVVITNSGDDLTYEPDADYCNDGIPDRRLHLHPRPAARPPTVEVTVNCVDDASIAVDERRRVDEDDPANDDRRPRQRHRHRQRGVEQIDSVTQPANGTVVITNSGDDLTYEPDADYCNDGTPTDDFTYTLVGGSTRQRRGHRRPASTTPRSPSTTRRPSTRTTRQRRSTSAATTPTSTVRVEVIESVTQPANGTVVITNSGADLTYEPDADYCNDGSPTDDFTYTLDRRRHRRRRGHRRLRQRRLGRRRQRADGDEDSGANNFDVRQNDTDIDSPVEQIDSVTQPANGTVVITNAGTDLTYEPDADYCNDGIADGRLHLHPRRRRHRRRRGHRRLRQRRARRDDDRRLGLLHRESGVADGDRQRRDGERRRRRQPRLGDRLDHDQLPERPGLPRLHRHRERPGELRAGHRRAYADRDRRPRPSRSSRPRSSRSPTRTRARARTPPPARSASRPTTATSTATTPTRAVTVASVNDAPALTQPDGTAHLHRGLADREPRRPDRPEPGRSPTPTRPT